MKLEFTPLLQVQRDLYRLPRGWERFRAYLQTLVDPETKDLQLPLSAMNPMGSAQATREETLTAVYRAAHIQQHGFAVTLREIMAQEGYAMAMAGCSKPSLDDDELEYAREVIAPNLDSKDYPTIFTSLFGDAAAASLGYAPLGLSERAGFALALSDAQKLCRRIS